MGHGPLMLVHLAHHLHDTLVVHAVVTQRTVDVRHGEATEKRSVVVGTVLVDDEVDGVSVGAGLDESAVGEGGGVVSLAHCVPRVGTVVGGEAEGAAGSCLQCVASVGATVLECILHSPTHVRRAGPVRERKLQLAARNATASKVSVLAVRVRRRATVAGKCYCSTAGKEEGSHFLCNFFLKKMVCEEREERGEEENQRGGGEKKAVFIHTPKKQN